MSANEADESSKPGASGPNSVEESVYEETAHAGKSGDEAVDPPKAAEKADAAEAPEIGADLEPDEAADVMKTREEASRIETQREDRQEEDIVTLDTPD